MIYIYIQQSQGSYPSISTREQSCLQQSSLLLRVALFQLFSTPAGRSSGDILPLFQRDLTSQRLLRLDPSVLQGCLHWYRIRWKEKHGQHLWMRRGVRSQGELNRLWLRLLPSGTPPRLLAVDAPYLYQIAADSGLLSALNAFKPGSPLCKTQDVGLNLFVSRLIFKSKKGRPN